MRIERIVLDNIKSFSHYETAFGSGMNFICGRNGAGKSTLVESIGLALFGAGAEGSYIQYFLRHGAKDGMIQVTFSHRGNSYTVKKKMRQNGTASRRVYDQNGEELDLHGERDVDDFIRAQLGLDASINLEKLFNEVVGARQGTLTQPFLDAPNERKRRFNAMLGVDRYKKAAQRLPALQNYMALQEKELSAKIEAHAFHTADLETDQENLTHIRMEMQTKEEEEKVLFEAVEKTEAVLQELTAREARRAKVALELASQRTALEKDEETYLRRSRELEEEIAAARQEYAINQVQLAEGEQTLTNLQQQKENAKAAYLAFDPQAALQPLTEQQNAISRAVAVCRADMQRIRENMQLAAQGQCPFLDVPCTSVSGSLCDALQQREAQLHARLQDLQEEEKAAADVKQKTTQEQKRCQQALRDAQEAASSAYDESRLAYTRLKARMDSLQEKIDRAEKEQQRLQNLQQDLPVRRDALSKLQQQLEKLQRQADPEALQQMQQQQTAQKSSLSALKERLKSLRQEEQRCAGEVEKKKQLLNQMQQMEKQRRQIRSVSALCRSYSQILGSAGERVAVFYRERLSEDATRIYRDISRQSAQLRWTADYDVELIDVYLDQERVRKFRQLSGGEQMTAALALRLGLLKRLSTADIAFFDEPTANLDAARRENLSSTLPRATRGFEQVFIISHDDTFDALGDTIIDLNS